MNDMFPSKDVVLNVMRAIAIRDNFQFQTLKSNKQVLVLSCIIDGCKWYLCARSIGDVGNCTWIIVRFDHEHSCSLDVVFSGHRQASFSVIKECIKKKITIDGSPLICPKDIVNYIRVEHRLTISYQKAWLAQEAAVDEIRGSLEDSYKMIPAFAYQLCARNLGSITDYKIDDHCRFIFFFMSLFACISGWEHCRPVVSDGTSLKNKYGGTLLTACAPDANDQIFSLAFCVDSENDRSWQWFMNQLKKIIGDRNDVVIVFDRHQSIVKAVELIRQLDSSARGIQDELESIGFEKWSRAFSPRRRYKIMTTNMSESLNSAILKARDLPVCMMLELLRMMMQQWFFDKRNEVEFQVTVFTRATELHLREQIDKGKTMQVFPVNNMQYQMIDGTIQHDVHLSSRMCNCRMWDILQISCPHACAVLSRKNLSIKDYVSPYYLNTKLSSIYKDSILPLGDPRGWNILEDVKSINCLPPNVKYAVGRPKKLRIPCPMEFNKRVKCGRCGRVGHNRRS